MPVIRCPSNCDHIWPFLHSMVTNERIVIRQGVKYREISTFVVCSHCHHWIDGPPCECVFKCHGYELGSMVDRTPLVA